MTFVKGKSGNPAGRSKLAESIKELAKSKAPRAFERICELVESSDEKIALQASMAIVDRAYGKPAQAIEHSGEITRYVIRAPQLETDIEEWKKKYQPKTQQNIQ